ncbi:MAG: hypothetical protein LBV63_03575 [Candidatus Methanoplasma sp.]|jgi:glycine cleavage system H protein|nr:hypothetical protein [Candidatus Methanoplasma sp.]
MVPRDDLLYTDDHLWIRRDGGLFTIGITEEGLEELETVLIVEIPKVGELVYAGQEIGSIESVKTVYPILSPVSGKIHENNAGLVDDVGPVAESPYEEGWLVRIAASDPLITRKFLNRSEYQEIFKRTCSR